MGEEPLWKSENDQNTWVVMNMHIDCLSLETMCDEDMMMGV